MLNSNGSTVHNILYILLLITYFGAFNGLQLSISDLLKSASAITSGVIQGAVSHIPTSQDVYDNSKHLLAGYPFEIAATAIDKACAAALSTKTIRPRLTPNLNELQLQFRTNCRRYNVPLQKVDKLHTIPDFDITKKVVILVTGWATTINTSDTIDAFAKAYACRGDTNFLALDAGYYVDTLYTWSALNTEVIGIQLAKGLTELVDTVPVENIHLIGHSLGAHIVGTAGRFFQNYTSFILPRITGLDPAKPCFNEGEVLTGLSRGDADFVDVIHSNPGVLGIREPIGDIDFYPGGLNAIPKGCITVLCAHSRAWEYFVETVYPGNEHKYFGIRCHSLHHLRIGNCQQNTAILGYGLLLNRKGNYFLEAPTDFTYDSIVHKNCVDSYIKCYQK